MTNFQDITVYLFTKVWELFNVSIPIFNINITIVEWLISLWLLHKILDIILFSVDKTHGSLYPSTRKKGDND